MGVPTFYRWLCSRYPRVLQDVKDDLNEHGVDMADEESFALALLSPNPNGEFDNLYIDMNGLIHPCCHPELLEQPPSEEVMFECIFDYIDRLFYLVRPRKLLFLAIDGVAPRAKMNQQRSRRFKSAAEADFEAETYEKVAAEFAKKNIKVPPKEERWDSNVITPGTPFMHELSKRIVKFIDDRRRIYDSWARIHIIYSDGNTPGEGEHKIMNFIRNQRHSPDYDPNTRHVLHGMDADLIMLGLATHEVNFYIIREIVNNINHNKKPEDAIRNAIMSAQTNAPSKTTKLKSDKSYRSMLRQHWKPMQFIRLPVLREYLSHQFAFPGGWKSGVGVIDFERCIDDLVLMCFFCGNDFLPHLPSISIPGGSIDQMILLYQNILPELGDYLTNEGNINMAQCDKFVSFIAKVEDQVFKAEQEFKQRRKARMQQQEANEQKTQVVATDSSSSAQPTPIGDGVTTSESPKSGMKDGKEHAEFDVESEFKKRCNEILKEHREIADPVEPIDLSLNDPKLWKAAYYREKFNLTEDDDISDMARNVATNYIRGMCWVLRYYYQGCASWGWYYPFHYAPFCSDLSFEGLEFVFEKGEPFTPYQQLMSVMPIRSSHCLPPELRTLMMDPDSPIASFYPTKFIEDPNGKPYKYQWIALLPFIDESKLLHLVQPIEAKLSEEYQERNCVKKEKLFAGRGGVKNFVGEVTENNGCYDFISVSAKKHKSQLLEGAIVPPSVLRIEDLMDDNRNRGFNCDSAKRMISNVLEKAGIQSSDSRSRKGGDVLGNFNRDFHQTHNQYDPHRHPNADANRQKRGYPDDHRRDTYRKDVHSRFSNEQRDSDKPKHDDERKKGDMTGISEGSGFSKRDNVDSGSVKPSYRRMERHDYKTHSNQDRDYGSKRHAEDIRARTDHGQPPKLWYMKHEGGKHHSNNRVDGEPAKRSADHFGSSSGHHRRHHDNSKPHGSYHRSHGDKSDVRRESGAHKSYEQSRQHGGHQRRDHGHPGSNTRDSMSRHKSGDTSYHDSKSKYLGGLKLEPPRRPPPAGLAKVTRPPSGGVLSEESQSRHK